MKGQRGASPWAPAADRSFSCNEAEDRERQEEESSPSRRSPAGVSAVYTGAACSAGSAAAASWGVSSRSSVSRRPDFIYDRRQFELGASEGHPGGTVRNSVPLLERPLNSFLVNLGLNNDLSL